MQGFEIAGKWCLPGADDNSQKVYGNLTFSPNEEAKLTLLGELSPDYDYYQTILGFSQKGKNITLLGCQLVFREKSYPGIPSVTYHVQEIFQGQHFLNEDYVKFFNISISYPNLDEWLGLPVADIKEYSSDTEVGWNIKFPWPLPKEIYDSDVFSLKYFCSVTISRAILKEPKISSKTYFSITNKSAEQEKSFHQFFRPLISSLADLLTLALYAPVVIDQLNGKVLGSGPHELVEVFFKQLGQSEPVRPDSMLFTFSDIKDNSQEFFQKWFDIRDKAKHALDLYFSLFKEERYLENFFLTSIRALEVYYRLVIEGKQWPTDEHEGLKPRVLKAAGEKYKKWVQDRIQWNEPALRNRLKDLFERAKLEELGYEEKMLGEALDLAVDTRNYLTHYSAELRDKSARDEQLLHLSLWLRGFLTVILLRELGFDSEKIRVILGKSGQFQSDLKKSLEVALD